MLIGRKAGWIGWLLAATVLVAPEARSQQAQVDSSQTAVTLDYYTQLYAWIDVADQPGSGNPAKNAFRSILEGLGVSSSAQSIAVSLDVSVGDTALPSYVLTSYDYDSGTKKLSVYRSSGHDFPRKRLASSERITAKVSFRTSDQAQYNLGVVNGALASLVPGSGLLNVVTSPFVRQMNDAGGKVLSTFGSSSMDLSYPYELSPLGENKKRVDLTLRDRDGRVFATVHLLLKASPTLLRDGIDVFRVREQDLRLKPGEDPASLETTILGVSTRYLDSLEGLEDYRTLAKAPSLPAIRVFCQQARSFLETRNGLTKMDSTGIMLRALEDAGFDDLRDDTAWFHECFVPVEKESLRLASGIEPPLPKPLTPDPIDTDTLWALGCWMLAAPGPQCASHAPDPQRVLRSRLGDRIAYNIDSGFIDTLGKWGDADSIGKDQLMESLKGTASAFMCFRRGVLLATNDRLFRFSGALDGGRISKIEIRPVPDEARNCTD